MRQNTGHSLKGNLRTGAVIKGVGIITSYREKTFSLDITLWDTKPAKYLFTAEIISPDYKRIVFSDSCMLDNKTKKIHLSWKWPDPKLWDIGTPNLYDLYLHIQGPGTGDTYTGRFGFREIWIKDKDFYLNGKKIHFRPVNGTASDNPPLVEKQIDNFIRQGFNLIEMWPEKTSNPAWPVWYDIADRKGIGVTGAVGNMWRFLNDWEDSGKRDFEALVAEEIRQVRNHPSVLLWGTNGNVFGSGLGMHPESLGIRKDGWYDCFYWRKRRLPRGEEGFSILKKFDSSRPVFAHHGGGIADVFTLNMYLNMIPLQEREEWLSYWANHDTMPLLLVEFGTPVHVALLRGRTDYPKAIHTEPWITEFAAIYFGKNAYKIETAEYRASIKNRFIAGQRYESWHDADVINKNILFQKIQELFIRSTWRSWRTWGISGGMVPWHLKATWGKVDNNEKSLGSHLPDVPRGDFFYLDSREGDLLPAGEALFRYNNDFLVWIAGKEGCFTEKGHNYYPGEVVEKQIVLINNSRESQNFSGTWKSVLEGNMISEGAVSAELGAGELKKIPLQYNLPDKLNYARNTGKITAVITIGEQRLHDEFTFTVFIPGKKNRKKIPVFDPLGDTSGYLRRLGYMPAAWDGKNGNAFLVIGRNCLKEMGPMRENLRKYIFKGGRVVIFSQDPDYLREIGFRVSRHVTRRVFAIAKDHPAAANLDDDDIRDFRGSGTLIDGYPEYSPGKTKLGKWWFPYYGYHWGNRGSVSSAAIEKPHKSSWRPILECEFDLAYSPLLELPYGNGMIVLCTLDIEMRTEDDPVADVLTDKILEYAVTVPHPEKGKTVLLGDKEDRGKLDELGIVYKTAEGFTRDAALTIIGKHFTYNVDKLKKYTESGGKVFFLPRKEGYGNLGVSAKTVSFYKSSHTVPDWEEFRGLSVSDIHSRTDRSALVLSGDAELGLDNRVARKKIGRGAIIFSVIDSDMLDADTNTYLRFTRWRETRTISQILSNMGAEFKADNLFFNPLKTPRIPISGRWEISLNQREWETAILPALWESFDEKYKKRCPDVFFKKIIDIPREMEGRAILLSLGKIDNTDTVYFNGADVSNTDERPAWPHNYPRVYNIPSAIIKKGKNTILIKLRERSKQFDAMGEGGFAGPEEDMYIEPVKNRYDVGFYHHDYREDYVFGDEPYRYFNF